MKKFDQYIKDNLSQPQTPPLDAWKNIEEKLDKKEKKKQEINPCYFAGNIIYIIKNSAVLAPERAYNYKADKVNNKCFCQL